VVLSATPLGQWVYGVWVGTMIGWIVTEHRVAMKAAARNALRVAAVGMCVLAMGMEGRYWRTPHLRQGSFPRMYVVGDSISAGLGTAGVMTWPQLLREHKKVEVVDLSRAAETVASALAGLKGVELHQGLVVLEIGGNDLLGGTAVADFQRGLEELLGRLSGPGRRVVMLELPGVPLRSEYGQVQRQLARRYQVVLVPKRRFAQVMMGQGNSLDGVHLSGRGQQHMAELVWEVCGGAMTR
jgi:acyl-CoA thioesterase-1